jgi:hypothetical protein
MMKNILVTYYLPWLIVMSIGFEFYAVVDIITKASFPVDRHLLTSIAKALFKWTVPVVGLTAISGGLHHFWYEYSRPRRRIKLFAKPALQELQKIGFTIDAENLSYVGVYQGYYVNITTDSDLGQGDRLLINAFIDPIEENIVQLKSLDKGYAVDFCEDTVWIEASLHLYLGCIPALEKIIEKMDELTNYLKKDRLCLFHQ